MSVTDHAASGRATHPRRYSTLTWWQSIGVATVAATVVNLLIFLLAYAGGASLVVLDQGAPHPVTAGGVVLFSVVPLVLGTGLARCSACGGTASCGWASSSAPGRRCSARWVH